ncbi:MAG: hypothetical protein WBC67_17825 [Candidatus Acidiferrales bacterium]
MQSVIWWASFALAIYWVSNWFQHRKLSLGHSAQWICAVLLCGVVAFFNRRPEISRYHMLWAMPAAFFGSSLLTTPYIRWRSRRRHPELFD